MKIIHLITGLTVGGAEQMLLKTVPYLQGEHVVISIIPQAKIGEELEAAGVDVRYLNLHSMLDIHAPFKLYKILRTEQPNILITYLLHADILGRLIGKLARVPKIISSIRCAHKDKKFFVWLSKLTANLADHYVAVSHEVCTWTQQRLNVPAENITVIHNGILLPELNSAKPVTDVPKDTITLTFIGRLDAQKGLQYLIQAAEILQSHASPWTLLLIGDGPERKNIEQQIKAKKLSNVRLLGFRRDVPAILQQSDIFVSPTLFEGISNAIMEAMSYSLSVVTTDIPENRELIDHEKNGIVVPVRSGSALAEALQLLMNNAEMRHTLGTAARKTIEYDFSIEHTREQLNTLFNSHSK